MLGTAPRVHAPPLPHGQGTWADSLIDEIVNGPPRPTNRLQEVEFGVPTVIVRVDLSYGMHEELTTYLAGKTSRWFSPEAVGTWLVLSCPGNQGSVRA